MKEPVSLVECCDNMEFMSRYPDKFFDLSIVDPPYGIDINMNMGLKKGQKAVHARKNWDKSIPQEAYFDELFRVSKNQVIWGGNYFPLPLTRSWIFWDKFVPDGVSFSDGELAWTSFDRTLVKANIPYTGFIGSEGKIHPTQKPKELYRWVLTRYANPGDKILDTHLGSGSIRIAAYDLKFDFYGCEIDPDYFKASCDRFDKETQTVNLFHLLS